MRARENPFAAARCEAFRYQLEPPEWEALFLRLDRHRWRGCLLGPHGSGKTTLLEDLAARARATRGLTPWWLRLNAGQDAPSSLANLRETLAALPPATLVCVDGAERASPFLPLLLRNPTRHLAGLLLTLHFPNPFLPVVQRTRTTPGLLARQVAHLLARDLTPGETAGLAARLRHCRGNGREVLRQLYLAWADTPAGGPLPPPGQKHLHCSRPQ